MDMRGYLIFGCLLIVAGIAVIVSLGNPYLVKGPVGFRGSTASQSGSDKNDYGIPYALMSGSDGGWDHGDWNRKYLRYLAAHGVGLLTEQEAIRRGVLVRTTYAPLPVAEDPDPYPKSVFVPLDEADVPVPRQPKTTKPVPPEGSSSIWRTAEAHGG